MNKVMISILSLAVGGTGGYFLGKVLTQKECDERIETEIQSVKEAFRKMNGEKKEAQPAETKDDRQYGAAPKGEAIKEEKAAYQETIRRTRYRHDDKTPETLKKMADALKPKYIDPADMGEDENYGDPVSLTYYADGVLCNDSQKPMSEIEIEQAVGTEFAEHFGEYEDDSVVVDNPMLKTYFEILRDERTYKQMLEENPYLVHE